MSLLISGPKAKQLAQEFAQIISGTVHDAVVRALEAQLVSLKAQSTIAVTRYTIPKIAARCKALPNIDQRSADGITGHFSPCTYWLSAISTIKSSLHNKSFELLSLQSFLVLRTGRKINHPASSRESMTGLHS